MTLRLSPALGAAFLLVSTVSAPAFSQPATTPTVAGAAGNVSAADPRAAEGGAQMLRAGGSATDAAIATMLVLTVVEPQSSGIGGGGFYVRANSDGAVETFDGRETAPAAATPEWFLDSAGNPRPFMDAVISGLSVGVPGNLRLAEEVHSKFGKLAWADLFAPAIALARDGFVITERLHEYLSNARNRAAASPQGKALFYDAEGEPLPVGTLVRNPELAATLSRIAAEGADTFYSGKHAEQIARAVSEQTPHALGMTGEDVQTYVAKPRPPVCASYRTYRICGMGPPSSGATTVLAILKQLEGFDLKALGPESPVSWHLFAESQRLAFADRELFLGDSDFVPVPVNGLIDDQYLAKRGALISADHALAEVAAGTPPPGDGPLLMSWADGDEPPENGTSHFVATDKWGNAVTYTSTIEGSFGSGIMVGGYYLNNELTDFSFSPQKGGKPVANRVEGGKRPRSSMAPTVVFDSTGRMVLAIGAAGGATIPVQVSKALIGYLDWGLSAQEAIALPMLFSPGDTLFVEPGTMLETMAPQLQALGHDQVQTRRLPLKANAVEWRDGHWIGAADPRSEGATASE